MRHLILFLPVVFFLTFCTGKKKIPGDVVSIEKMHLVLWEVIKADEYILYQSAKDTSLQKEQERLKLYNQILGSHNVTDEDFRKSMNFYQKNPDLLKIILDSIQKKSDRINSPPETISMVD